MANKYWVGGTGNWSDSTNHWATSTGGAPGVGNIPNIGDNVIFDTASNGTSYTCTIDKAANCNDITFANPATGTLTMTHSATLNVYGNFTTSSSTITRSGTGAVNFKAKTTGKTITLNSVALSGGATFFGVGGGWTLQDTFSCGAVNINAGALNTNGQTVTCTTFNTGLGLDKSLTLGASIINCQAWGPAHYGNFTFDAGTSSIRVTASGVFTGFGYTYYEVQLNGTEHVMTGTNTFTNLIRTGTATKTDTVTITNNITVTGTLTLTGNSAINRLLIQTASRGTQVTITAGTVTASNIDIKDIKGAGAGNWDLSAITGLSGDCGGNSDITCTAPTTQYYYKASGNDNFSTAANWFVGTGGSGGAGHVPLPQDTARFDASSFGAASMTITQDMPRMGGINFTGATNSPTLTPSPGISIFGSITLIAAMTLTASTGVYTMEGRGSYSITNAGKTWNKGFTFNCITGVGTYTLQDELNIGASTITVTSGTLNTNNQTVTCTNLTVAGLLVLGSSTLNLSGTLTVPIGGLTAGTSTINIASAGNLVGAGNTFNIVNLNGTAHTISGTNTFATLTRTGTATKTDTLTITNNIIVTGTLTLSGNSATNRLLVKSAVKGTQVTITAGTVTCSNVDLQDMKGAGSGSWNLSAITGLSGDCGGNDVSITFTTGITCYAKTNASANWSAAIWFTSTGGSTATRVPLPQDIARFDASSITAGSVTITQDMPRIGSMNWTSVTNTPTLTGNLDIFIFGDLTFVSGMVFSAAAAFAYNFNGRGAQTITSGGLTIDRSIIIDCVGGTYTLQDNLNIAARAFSIPSGTIDFNNKNLTALSFGCAPVTQCTINMGSGIIALSGLSTAFVITGTLVTVNAGTSTIKLTSNSASGNTFGGNGLTYYNLSIETLGAGATTITGNNTFNDLKIDAGRTVSATSNAVQTVNTFTAVGTSGAGVITLKAVSANNKTFYKCTTGTINCDYLNLTDIGVTGGATWNEGANSTFVTGNSGWVGNPAIDRYWVTGGNGYYDNPTNWSLTDGGASGASLPIGGNAIFNANSGSGTVNLTSTAVYNNIDFTGFTGSVVGSSAITANGSFTLSSSMIWDAVGSININYNGSNKTVTTAGLTTYNGFTITSISDTITLQDDILTYGPITLTSGILDCNNKNITATGFASSGALTRTLYLKAGLFTAFAVSAPWNFVSTGITLYPGTSTIKVVTKYDGVATICSFSGGGLTYNNLWVDCNTVLGFNITGSNIFNDLKISPNIKAYFQSGLTQTATTYDLHGTAGNLITLSSISGTSYTLAKAGFGTIFGDYLNIKDSTATPANTFYAGTHSTDSGNNSGWGFTAGPYQLPGMFLFF